MKERISATVDKETLKLIDRILKLRRYRNKSHVIEEAIERFWKELNKDKEEK